MNANQKRKIAAIAAAAAMIVNMASTGCTQEGQQEAFHTDTVSIDRTWSRTEGVKDDDVTRGLSHYKGKIAYPAKDEQNALSDSVKAWLNSVLLPGEKNLSKTMLEQSANNFLSECEASEYGQEKSVSILKTYDKDGMVTFEYTGYSLENKKHSCTVFGATFVKSTGHRLTWQDFEGSTETREKITKAIREQHNEIDESKLKSEMTIPLTQAVAEDGTLLFPLPQYAPWLTEQGWSFTFQPMEILPLNYGAIACCLPNNAAGYKK